MGSEQGGNKGVGVSNCQIMPNEKDCILGLPCIKHVGWPVAHFFSLFFSSLSTIFHLVTELKKIHPLQCFKWNSMSEGFSRSSSVGDGGGEGGKNSINASSVLWA